MVGGGAPHLISPDSPAGIRRLEDSGVTDVIVGFGWPYDSGPDTEAWPTQIDSLRRFSEDVIATEHEGRAKGGDP